MDYTGIEYKWGVVNRNVNKCLWEEQNIPDSKNLLVIKECPTLKNLSVHPGWLALLPTTKSETTRKKLKTSLLICIFGTINVRINVIVVLIRKRKVLYIYNAASMTSIYLYLKINRSDFLRNDWQFAIGSFERSNWAKSKTPTIST